jgi:2-oxoisovalerate dehydrogenase E1 component
MDHDDSVFLAGIDVGDGGNVFGLTRGLAEKYPGRVRDTPISESAIIGTGVGAAMAGLRPVVELMYFDFLGVCFDQLLNQAAKLRFMTGGAVSLPMVVRTQFGAGKSSGSQHSQSLEALLAHIPGLTVVMPSTPADTYGLLRAAIRDPNPVIFVENRLMYGRKGPQPPPEHLIPLGRAAIRREGTDVTLVSYSKMMQDCEAAVETLAAEGISVELIDLRTVAPLDTETVLRSLAKTNRLVVAHQAVGEFGVGAELAAVAAREGFWNLDAPVIRVGAEPTPAPYSPSLEKVWLPGKDRILAAVRESIRT